MSILNPGRQINFSPWNCRLFRRSRYIMLQSFAKGDTLTSYHASISGQADKLKDEIAGGRSVK